MDSNAELGERVATLSQEVRDLYQLLGKTGGSNLNTVTNQSLRAQYELHSVPNVCTDSSLNGAEIGHMFKGVNGLRRLLGLILDTYPWLLPEELESRQNLLNENNNLKEQVLQLKEELLHYRDNKGNKALNEVNPSDEKLKNAPSIDSTGNVTVNATVNSNNGGNTTLNTAFKAKQKSSLVNSNSLTTKPPNRNLQGESGYSPEISIAQDNKPNQSIMDKIRQLDNDF